MDFYGGDGTQVGAHSPEECCKFCQAKAKTADVCKAFVFNPTKVFGDKSDPSLKACDLKKAMSPAPTPDCPNCKVVPNPERTAGLLRPTVDPAKAHTLSMYADPNTCWDGMSGGPSAGQDLMTHMWRCYTAPNVQNYDAAKAHQLWNYDTTTMQLKLTNAYKMSDGCQLERGIDYWGGDYDGNVVGIKTVDECCDLCRQDPKCKVISVGTTSRPTPLTLPPPPPPPLPPPPSQGV
jgi:hypothetical protein